MPDKDGSTFGPHRRRNNGGRGGNSFNQPLCTFWNGATVGRDLWSGKRRVEEKEMFRPRRSFSRHGSSFFGQTIFCLTSPTVGMGRGEKLKSEEACKKNFESPNFRVSLAEKRNDHKRKNATSFAWHAKRKKRRQTPHRHHPPAPPPPAQCLPWRVVSLFFD